MSAGTGDFILEQVEEIISNMETGEERTVSIYVDTPLAINFERIAVVSWPGKNITMNGPKDVVRVKNEKPKIVSPQLDAAISPAKTCDKKLKHQAVET